jgi:carboxyl-terminal processing protease
MPTSTRTLLFMLLALLAATVRAQADDQFRDGEKAFLRAREMLQKGYVDDKVSDDRMWRGATEGLLHGVGSGKWDKLLSPSELAAIKADLVGEVVGLGVQIDVDPDAGIVDVRGVVPSSGAERAGLMVGDKILRLDGKTFKGMTRDEVARTMRGKPGTSATLTILRDAEIVTRTIKRAPFVVDPVMATMLPNGVGLVQLKMITGKTPALTRDALDKLRGMKGLVIDLRDNQGGRYDSIFDIAALFVPKGALIVSEIRRGGGVVEKRNAGEPRVSVPMAVLVDASTSSGAEVLAGALKQAGAKIVGKRTMGKWNAQELQELGNGWGVKYTTMVFRAPWGALLDGRGLDPDVEVEADVREVAKANAMKDGDKRLAADAQLRVATTLLKLAR